MRRSTAPSRPPAGPPATTEAAAAFVRDYAVKLYDRQDGQGVDWQKVSGALFRAAFDAMENMPQDKRRDYAIRAYDRLSGVLNDEPAASHPPAAEAGPAPANAGGLKSPRPRPPR